jgi:hypothetical protein
MVSNQPSATRFRSTLICFCSFVLSNPGTSITDWLEEKPSGTCWANAAERTPGIARRLSISCRWKRRPSASAYRESEASMVAIRMPCVRKPGSNRSSLRRSRTSSPAMVSSGSATATCPATRRSRNAMRRERLPGPLSPDLSTEARSVFSIWNAGASPKSSELSTAAASENRSTRSSRRMVSDTGSVVGNSSVFRARMAPTEMAMPPALPIRPSSRLSVSNWRSSRPRPAPIAMRTANSRERARARLSSRFATFAHAINRTMPEMISSIRTSVQRDGSLWICELRSSIASTLQPRLVSG